MSPKRSTHFLGKASVSSHAPARLFALCDDLPPNTLTRRALYLPIAREPLRGALPLDRQRPLCHRHHLTRHRKEVGR
jgi:hypothetical protein